MLWSKSIFNDDSNQRIIEKNTKSNQNQEDSDGTVHPNPVFAKLLEKEFLRNKNGNQAVPKTISIGVATMMEEFKRLVA